MRKVILFCLLFIIPFNYVLYAQTIVNDPEVISEGIWFVIQNKSDVDQDYAVPAGRKALKVDNSGAAVMGIISMDSTVNIDEFLWRTVAISGGNYKLINKKEGSTKALSSAGNALMMASTANSTDQAWLLNTSNVSLHGANVYILNTAATTSTSAFELSGSSIVVNATNNSNTSQCWVFQPMELAAGYTMPTAPTDISGVSYRTLMNTQFSIMIAATPTTSDWALLNTHLIYKNMFNALLPSVANAVISNSQPRIAIVISKGDPNQITSTTPYLYSAGYTTTQMAQLRGGVFGNNGTMYILTTEEMMCKVGVYNRPSDVTYREFDQVIHEMTHAIDALGGINASNSPSNPYQTNKAEWFPYVIQRWFNNDFALIQYNGAVINKLNMGTNDYNYATTIMNQNNTWLPPRNFRGDDPYNCAPPIVYVNQAIPSSGDGASWSSAFKTLEEALALANSCVRVLEIRVASGTYYPTNVYGSTNPRDAVFAITRSNLRVIGGYNASTGLRNLSVNSTYLSGDIGQANLNTDNTYHVLVIGGINAANTDSIIVDGFIIRDGYADGSGGFGANGATFYRNNGGGLHTNGAHPRTLIKNCVFTQNSGSDGSALSIQNSVNPSFVNCLLTGNQKFNSGAGYTVLTYNSFPSFVNTTIADNSAGGGIVAISTTSAITVSNSIIWSNNGTSTSGTFDINYSNVDGASAPSGTGNLNVNPNFKNTSNAIGADNVWGTADDGFHLMSNSPSKDFGSNSSIPSGITTDITGATRIYGTTVDMGAYEYNPCSGFQTLYVDGSVTTSGLGNTWAVAYKTLDEALDKAWSCPNIDRIEVAQGTYVPLSHPYTWQSDGTGIKMAISNNLDKTFHIRQGLEIYGGYPTGGGVRDFMANPTILSGAGVGGIITDSAHHVVFTDSSDYWVAGYTDTTILDGFTITRGRLIAAGTFITVNGNAIYRNTGAGFYNADGNLLVRNSVFNDNKSNVGGGYFSGVNSITNMINNYFANNTASAGAGAYINSSKSNWVNCIFYQNFCNNGGGAYIANNVGVHRFVNNTFVNNNANIQGGGMYILSGNVFVSNNIFYGNISAGNNDIRPGGILLSTNNLIGENPEFIDISDIDGVDNILRTADDGLQLMISSPAVSGGNNDSILNGITIDFMGANRIQRGVVDMGAYESPYGPYWTGATSTGWNTASNWADNVVPATNSNVIVIPATGVTNEPTLATNETHKKITIAIGRTLTINSGNSLTLSKEFINNGTTLGNGKVVLAGNIKQGIGGIGNTNNIELNNTGGALAGVVIAEGAGNKLNVTGSLTLTAGILTTNDNLILKSTATGTARVAAVAGGSISGNAVVERYIGIPAAKQAWRLITAPLKGSNGLISANWQNDFDGNNSQLTQGVGTNISGPAGTLGADFTSTDYSLKKYDVAAQALSGVSDISTETLFGNTASAANKPFFVYVKGDKTITTGTTTNNTTLKAIGQLQTGTQTFSQSLGANQFWVVGNPYASPVDFDNITISSNLPKRFWVWDPNLNAVGGYVTVDNATGTGYTVTPSTGTSQSQYLQSGQAFFVQKNNTATSTASLTFEESDKSDNSINNVFKGTSIEEKFNGLLYGVDGNNPATVLDGFTILREASYSASVDEMDAEKLQNVNENIGISKGGKTLSIERTTHVSSRDTVRLNFTNTREMSYRFSFEPTNYASTQMIYLRDSFLNTFTPISATGVTDYNFTVSSVAGSSASNRFSLLFTGNTPLPIKAIVLSGSSNGSGSLLSWTVKNESNAAHYDLERSTDGKQYAKVYTTSAKLNDNSDVVYNYEDGEMPSANKLYYRVQSKSQSNEVLYSNTVAVTKGASASSLVVYPNPLSDNNLHLNFNDMPAGAYQLRIISSEGKLVYTTAIMLSQSTRQQQIKLPSSVTTGVYQLEVVSENGGFKQTSKITVR